jgi:hypothetical protein
MKYKEEPMPQVITLTEKGSQTLSRILREPSTRQQKRIFEQSRGLYARYQAEWQKKI